MVVKMNNTNPNFYKYMGKFFGSRLVERQTSDRIYDDSNKEWYIYLEDNEKVSAFASVTNNVIKNIYTLKEKYLEEVLDTIKKEIKIEPSVVSNLYVETYEKCGLVIDEAYEFKKFVVIHSK